jgi:hypothetical protein
MAAQSASWAASNSGRSYMGSAAILIADADTMVAAPLARTIAVALATLTP